MTDKTEPQPQTDRIAKVMARAGVASRREAERMILEGRVAVNGTRIESPALDVGPGDRVTVDGKPLEAPQETRLWLYYKPLGLVTSESDEKGRQTVFDALPRDLPRVMTVGRLDLNSEGLLLLTNDGELSRALELPSTALVRQYRARARGKITQAQLDTLKNGVTIDGVDYGPIEATLDKAKESKSEDGKAPANLWVSVSITEGKNREVRKVLESVGLTVNRLIRLAYGPFRLDVLPIGSVEEIGPRVIRELLSEYIRPENLPTGNTVETPAPIPGRRISTPIVKGKSGSAMSDPSRKPSRIRAAEAATEEAAERPAKKPGWAKAAPKFEHKKTFKPREGAPAQGERPARPFKSKEGATFSDRPKRDFKPRAGGDKHPSAGAGAGRDFKPRGKPAGPSGTSGRGPGGKPRSPRG